MRTIESPSNPVYRKLLAAAGTAGRRRRGAPILLDGPHLVSEALDAGLAIATVVVSEAAGGNPEIDALLRRIGRSTSAADTIRLPQRLFDRLSPVSTPSGIAAVCTCPATGTAPTPVDPCLVLDRIQDPGNLGSILRSAGAAGVRIVVVSGDTADPWSPRALRGGMGAQLRLSISEWDDPVAAVEGSPRVLATVARGGRSIYDVDLTGAVALLIGNEGQGLGSRLLDRATERITIPMASHVESLNAAAAAAVVLFERSRQTRATDGGRPHAKSGAQ
jgi:TrmH family RNA methyltransferase